ncbi:MAG: hypothetical protein ACRCZI_14235, partial [Cetobacterium sp.]
MKFAPNSQGTGKNHTYATVKDYVLQYIQKTYDGGYDVATSLEDEVMVDLNSSRPVRNISEKTDAAEQKLEQEGHDIDYGDALKRWNDRKDLLDREMKKAYSLIKENYCTRAMQSRIEEHPDYAGKIRNDPIELLKAIKILMHDAVRAQYPIVSMCDALSRLFAFRQQDDENLLDYVKRFKQQRDIVKQQCGKNMFDDFMKNTQEYRGTNSQSVKTEILAAGFDKVMAYLLMKGADQHKYGTLTKGLISQYSMGNQYPRTIQAATDILS